MHKGERELALLAEGSNSSPRSLVTKTIEQSHMHTCSHVGHMHFMGFRAWLLASGRQCVRSTVEMQILIPPIPVVCNPNLQVIPVHIQVREATG